MNPRDSMPSTLSTADRPAGSRPGAATAATTAGEASVGTWAGGGRHDGGEGLVVAEERGDVLEEDPGFGQVRSVRDQRERVGQPRPGSGHLLPRLDRGWRVGCWRPAEPLGRTGPRACGGIRP